MNYWLKLRGGAIGERETYWRGHGDKTMKTTRYFELWRGEHFTGFRVRHCGHPTAHFPWYIQTDHELDGHQFHGTHRYLKDAKETAEGLESGELVRRGANIIRKGET